MCDDESSAIVELNVGGVHYTTTRKTLTSDKSSRLCDLFSGSSCKSLTKDAKGRIFLDRDGVLFRYILDYLRDDGIQLPDGFREKDRLLKEAEHFKLNGLIKCLQALNDANEKGCITVGYRGSFQFGKDGLADVKFRKLSRILVCGRVALCRDVFGDTLNESRGRVTEFYSFIFYVSCFKVSGLEHWMKGFSDALERVLKCVIYNEVWLLFPPRNLIDNT